MRIVIMSEIKDCDHVLFCEADIAVEPGALERLLHGDGRPGWALHPGHRFGSLLLRLNRSRLFQ